MTRMTMTALAVSLLALAACTPNNKKDYDASANCETMGYQPGNADYDKCVSDEKAATMMEEQRKEYEEMKQQQEDYRQQQDWLWHR